MNWKIVKQKYKQNIRKEQQQQKQQQYKCINKTHVLKLFKNLIKQTVIAFN